VSPFETQFPPDRGLMVTAAVHIVVTGGFVGWPDPDPDVEDDPDEDAAPDVDEAEFEAGNWQDELAIEVSGKKDWAEQVWLIGSA